ncbi:MAG: hypothetical protein Q9222_002331 [Ikaeria aurantiellina]
MSISGTSTSVAAVMSSSQQDRGFNNAELLSTAKSRLPPAINTAKHANEARSGHLNLDTFSPVNQNGSFEFDRVLKSGEVYKRTKNTKQWKKYYLVLRPNLLSVYKSPLEERLHKQISLSELNTVALVKDRKGRREHLFGLYTPARNYHLQARDERDARAWVELIRREARIEEQERGIHHATSLANDGSNERQLEQERFASSSPEPIDIPTRLSTTRDGIKIPGIRGPSTHNLDYSGDDIGYSDWSDAPRQSFAPASHGSFVNCKIRPASELGPTAVPPSQQGKARNSSPSSGLPVQDDERVVWHGYLLILKSKSGVRQWKRVWAVLRPKNLAFYKSEEEYAALLIMPLSSIINAVEIDPVSRSKSHCMQIIAEERNMRLCAPSEEALARWLGALKSRLALRKERRKSTTL